jgi:hypothetical protein
MFMRWKRRLKLAWHVLAHASSDVPAPSSTAEEVGSTDCPPDSIEQLEVCPVCAQPARTIVAEFNKFILMAKPPDEAASRYDYALCHGCGVVYASQRPVGNRYSWLFRHFEETIGRADTGLRSIRKLTLSAVELREDDRAELRRTLKHGVFVSEHLRVSKKDYMPSLLKDRLSVAPHVELLGSLLDLKSARVLEIRSRTGALSGALTRLYGVQAKATALWAHQRLVIQELYGIPAFPMDFESFIVPEGGPYRLVIANHAFTHSVRPRSFFAAIRKALEPGGYLYLYNEPDDTEFVSKDRSMFKSLNGFHLQVFDGPSLVRALSVNGFSTVMQVRDNRRFAVLARVGSDPAYVPISARALTERRQRYQRGRDYALLRATPAQRERFESLWRAAADRLLASGEAEVDHAGRIRLRKGGR